MFRQTSQLANLKSYSVSNTGQRACNYTEGLCSNLILSVTGLKCQRQLTL